ncbi:hypothetical protein KW789_01860 [Candidatus Saccharibacteria bacterium]|nr:hypothetical protein [Candidatus Saccharibacteria bacterium]
MEPPANINPEEPTPQPQQEHVQPANIIEPTSPATGIYPSLPISNGDPFQPASITGGGGASKKSKLAFLRLPKRVTPILIILLILGGGSAAGYFGYYLPNKPENIWRTALTNTGKGYDKLSSYATSNKNIKGLSLKGGFKFSGVVATDGSFDGSSQGGNSQLTGNVSAVGLKIAVELRTISTNGNSPDIYFKVNGLEGLGNLFGVSDPTYATALNGLNNQWYVVDHTLFDQFAKGSNSSLQITNQDVSSILKAIGDSSKQYVFTNDEKKMAFKVKQAVGKEKVDGRNTYHYKVAVNKTNLKAYINSLCTNLKKSKLGKIFDSSGQNFEQTAGCTQAQSDTAKINESDTADVWVDLHTKLIHKVRFSDKTNASSYFDIAQDYQGGDTFPFSLSFSDGQGNSKTTGSVKMTLNMKTNVFTMNGDVKSSGDSSESGTFNLNISPSTAGVQVSAPTGAKNILQLLNDLGIPQIYGGVQSSAKDTERKTDLNALRGQLEAYYADSGKYPTLANLNSPSWVSTNLKGLDAAALQDPEGTSAKLLSAPAAKAYAYKALPVGCDNVKTDCTDYTLTATLGDGTTYAKQSLNSSDNQFIVN